MTFKDYDEKRAVAENGRERNEQLQLVTTIFRDVEGSITANPICTTDEQDLMNAIEIELVHDITKERSNRFLTSADSITAASGDVSHGVEIDEYELEPGGFGIYVLELQEDKLFDDLNPFCVDLESMGKVACCFADTILDGQSVDSLHIMEGDVDFLENSYTPEDKPSDRFLVTNKNGSLNQNYYKLILNENGGNNEGVVNDNDGIPSSYQNGIGSRIRREDNTIVNLGGSDDNANIKGKISTPDDECLLSVSTSGRFHTDFSESIIDSLKSV